MTIETTIQIWRVGKQFVAHAMPIDVMSSGLTPETARAALDEAIRAFVMTATDMGTLNEVLTECGYEARGDEWSASQFVSVEQHVHALAV